MKTKKMSPEKPKPQPALPPVTGSALHGATYQELDDANAGLSSEVDGLRIALEKSVHLQSHYAHLLNMHDGGQRIGFKNADEWIARLRVTGTLPPNQKHE